MIVLTLTAALAGAAAGMVTRAWLRRDWWRRDGESQPLPLPWEPVGLACVWGLAVVVLAGADVLAAWPAYAMLGVIGVALASIDLAVHRLPDVLTLGGLLPVSALLVLASALTGHWWRWSVVPWAVGIAAVLLIVLALGGMGLGDVKLGILLTLALSWLNLTVALLGLVLGFVIGGAWAGLLLLTGRARRGSRFAYGPSMLLGALSSFAVFGAG